jgi:hypothetical protein
MSLNLFKVKEPKNKNVLTYKIAITYILQIRMSFDEFVKSHQSPHQVIPAKAGIQKFKPDRKPLDPGFHRGDNFFTKPLVLFNH